MYVYIKVYVFEFLYVTMACVYASYIIVRNVGGSWRVAYIYSAQQEHSMYINIQSLYIRSYIYNEYNINVYRALLGIRREDFVCSHYFLV